jgi:hypothetical protein
VSDSTLDKINTSFDSTLVKAFFMIIPIKNQSDVEKLYRKHQFHYIWYSNRVNEFGNLLQQIE